MKRVLALSLAALAVLATLPGGVAAQPTKTVHDGATYWQGQTLERSDGVPNGATVSVRATTHQYYREYSAGRDGTVQFDTDGYKPGTYSLRRQGEEIARFHIEVQSIKIATESVDHDTGTVNFTVQTPRAKSDIIVNTSSLTNTQLEHIFNAYTTTEKDVDGDNRDEVIVRDVRRDQPLTGDFTDSRGTHTLRFDVLDTDAAARAKVSVGWPSYQEVALLDNENVEHRGDIVPIRIALPDTKTARLNIGKKNVNYVLNASVTDSDGDNRVTVYLDTTEMGQSGQPLTASGGDVGVLNETRLSGRIDTAEYPVSVVDGNGNNDDSATLSLKHGQSKTTNSYTYPKGETPESLLAVQDGSRGSTVVENQSIALVYEVSGVYSTLRDATAGDLADGIDGIQLRIVGEAGMNQNERPALDVREGDLLVHPDKDTLVLVLDTSDVQAPEGSDWTATLSFDGRDLENLSTTFTVQPVTASFKTPLPPARTHIRGHTNYETGSTVTLGIYGRGGSIQQSRHVKVGEDGAFKAPVDLRTLDGESLHVRLRSHREWQELKVRDSAETVTTATTAASTHTTTAETPTPTTTVPTTTTVETSTTPTTYTPTTTASWENDSRVSWNNESTTTSRPSPDSGLLSGLGSTLGIGVAVVLVGLVLGNRIAD